MLGQAFGLYTHIAANRRRSALLIAGLFLLVAMVTFALTLMMDAQLYRAPFPVLVRLASQQMWLHLPIAFAITALWVLVGFQMNTALIAWATGATDVTREANPRLYRLTENLCISRGMSVPKLQILETPALNAFASGVNEKQFTVTVTSGLMEALDDAELEAVIAHELTHIRNGDVKLMIVAVLIAGVVSFFGEMMVRGRWRSSSSGESDKGSGRGLAMLLGIAILLLAWLFAIIIRFALSRSREYLADAGAVELTKNPDAMISALLKISGRADIDGVPSGIMDMCIENDPDDFADIFSTHPSIAKRLNALQAYAGGRVPMAEPPRVGDRQSVPQIVERRSPWHRGGGEA